MSGKNLEKKMFLGMSAPTPIVGGDPLQLDYSQQAPDREGRGEVIPFLQNDFLCLGEYWIASYMIVSKNKLRFLPSFPNMASLEDAVTEKLCSKKVWA